MTELDSDELLNRQRNWERDMIDQQFYEMNRQIGELTNIALALTQQISSNIREGNELNTATTVVETTVKICRIERLVNVSGIEL